jgi:fumarate hydratase class II
MGKPASSAFAPVGHHRSGRLAAGAANWYDWGSLWPVTNDRGFAMTDFRLERDSMGEVRLPADVYYGAQTQRAVENFPISGRTLPVEMIHAMGLVKWAAAQVNRDLGRLSGSERNRLNDKQVEALVKACREVADGRFDDQFPVDVFQTGSGTSSNMNTNEVIANRAIELSGGDRFAPEKPIHPNDHVNLGQSTNDTFPTAIHVAVAAAIGNELVAALAQCQKVLSEKAERWQEILKIGRTHLSDATPLTLGQEIGGLARQLELSQQRAVRAQEAVGELPVGGTAVGSGINTHPEFGRRVCEVLAKETGMAFVEAADHFEANAQRDALIECHGQLRAVAATLYNVANNIRWLNSGPRCGFSEIKLVGRQPGSSIMPGKVNPVMCEALMQVAARVMGNDQTIAVCGATGGQFQLNIMMPVMADTMLESIRLLHGGTQAFTDLCLVDMQPNAEACEAAVEKSLALATGLNPYIGYEQAAALAKEAMQTGKTIRQLCQEKKVLPEKQLNEALDPWRMTRPS